MKRPHLASQRKNENNAGSRCCQKLTAQPARAARSQATVMPSWEAGTRGAMLMSPALPAARTALPHTHRW